MSKKYKGKICAYCGTATADTEDHVLARQFFTEDEHGNLPKAPACSVCNNEKSKLEHYLDLADAALGLKKDSGEAGEKRKIYRAAKTP